MKSGNLNFLEPSGPLQACKRDRFTFTFYLQIETLYWKFIVISPVLTNQF